MEKKLILLSFLLLLLFTAFGCGGGGGGPTVETLEWVDDGNGYVRFYTNDKERCGFCFFCFDEEMEEPIESMEFKMKKISGNKDTAYGVVFCVQKDDHYKTYCICINSRGFYAYFKNPGKGKNWEEIKEWTTFHGLKAGYDIDNSIKIENTETENGIFNVYINGELADPFTDISDNPYNNGYYGFIADVGNVNLENFPEVPVDVRFKMVNQASTKAIQTYKMPKRSSAQGCWDTGSFGY